MTGYSQGGWVGPLAASQSKDVKYVIVNYGMINSPSDEERIETVAAMARRGFEGKHLKQVEALSLAAINILAHEFREGWKEFDSLADQYHDETWMDHLENTTV